MPQTAAEILHNARWMAGLSQAEVAQRAGVSQQMIAQYERGRKQPSFATLAALVAGCGVELTTHLVPRPGLEDEPTRELLARPVLERLPEDFRRGVVRLAATAEGLPFLIGGKAAARLHGAYVRVPDLELWLPSDVDPDVVTAFLRRLDAAEVSRVTGEVYEPVAARIRLLEGWGLAAPDVDLHLRAVPEYPEMRARAQSLQLPDGGTSLYADAYDATTWWHPRDRSHLGLQRALRLTSDKRSAVTTDP